MVGGADEVPGTSIALWQSKRLPCALHLVYFRAFAVVDGAVSLRARGCVSIVDDVFYAPYARPYTKSPYRSAIHQDIMMC